MRRVVLVSAVLISTILAASEASAQVPQSPSAASIYGSYYRTPYDGVGQWNNAYRGGMQSMPWGGQIYSGAYHPTYLGYRGRYSPSPALPHKRSR